MTKSGFEKDRADILSALADGRWAAPQSMAVEGVSRRTLNRHLAALVNDGVLERRGAGRAIEYRQNPLATWFSVPPDQRPPVAYDPHRLGDYIPGKTQWLSKARRDRMRAAQPAQIEAGSYPLAVSEKLMVDLSYASSHLEGNTYNYLDTETLVRYGQAATEKEASETTMILNHKQAVAYLVEIAQSEEPVLPRTIRELHALLSDGLIDQREMGALRQRKVAIGGSSYTPLDIPSKIEEEFKVLVEKAGKITDPFEQSLFWMVQVAYLQPFVDVNKRTGRLACNIPLLKAGMAPLSFMSMDKAKYIKGLLEFYELGATETIAAAFEEAYVASAYRYEAHVARDPAAQKIDRAYKQELSEIIRSFVASVVNEDPDEWDDIVSSCLTHVSDQGIRASISRRANELLQGLNEANRIVYGIGVDQYEAFLSHTQAVEGSAPPPPDRGATRRPGR